MSDGDKTVKTTIDGDEVTAIREDGFWWAYSDTLANTTILAPTFSELRRMYREHLAARKKMLATEVE